MSQPALIEVVEDEVEDFREEAQFVSLPPVVHDRRRQHARHVVKLEVTISSDHNFYAGFTENVSEGGLFVATHVQKPLGERLALEIRLPGETESMNLIGEVRWLRDYSEDSDAPPGLGLRFVDLTPEQEHLVSRFLANRDALFFEE